jgi:AbrB family looped-hinge helix DNA binding protein
MNSVTISTKFQVVIPREVRDRLRLHKGQKMLVFERNGFIQLIPDRDIKEMRGIAKGMSPSMDGIRDEEDRF